MRKLVYVLIVLTTVLAALPLQSALAQTGGCLALDGLSGTANPTLSLGSKEFTEGDKIVVVVTGTGTNFSLLEGGSVVAGPAAMGASLAYIIPADGTYQFSVQVAGSDATTTSSVSCTPAESFPPGMICHIPPGNPYAAHTITVGEPAVEAHLKHGDTLGPCPRSRQTKFDDFEAGVAIFIISATGEISIWGNCDGEDCEPIVITTVTQIININLVVIVNTDGAHFVEVDDPEDYQFELPDDVADGQYIVIYYLHPDPTNDQVGVFQLNVYRNGTLVSDKILIFIDVDGNIVQWATHEYWLEMLQNVFHEE